MGIDEDLVSLVDRTLVSLDWSGVNSFTLWISTGIGPPIPDAAEAAGRVVAEPDGGIAAMLKVLAGGLSELEVGLPLLKVLSD